MYFKSAPILRHSNKISNMATSMNILEITIAKNFLADSHANFDQICSTMLGLETILYDQLKCINVAFSCSNVLNEVLKHQNDILNIRYNARLQSAQTCICLDASNPDFVACKH